DRIRDLLAAVAGAPARPASAGARVARRGRVPQSGRAAMAAGRALPFGARRAVHRPGDAGAGVRVRDPRRAGPVGTAVAVVGGAAMSGSPHHVLEEWWLASLGRTIVWARLRVREAGTAEVFDSDGATLVYDSEDTARAMLLDADF